MKTLTNAQVRDIEVLLHPATNLATHRQTGPLVLERGEGVYVWDTTGKRYIEGLAGLWCTALGYGNQELVEAAREQMSRLPFTHLFGGRSHEPAIELAEKLKELSPAPTSKVFFTSSGSEANDTQIKLAWYYNNARGKPKKKKIIGRMRGYHGVTIASASLTGLPIFHADFDLPMARVVHADCPHHYRGGEPGETEEDFATRMADNLDALIQREDPETVAAFIAEPVQGAGGVIVPPKTYFEKVQPVLDRYDIRLIADEVICGFGRTGNWFGSQTFKMTPDSISVAKAITSAYVPLGAVTVSEPVYQALVSGKRETWRIRSRLHLFRPPPRLRPLRSRPSKSTSGSISSITCARSPRCSIFACARFGIIRSSAKPAARDSLPGSSWSRTRRRKPASRRPTVSARKWWRSPRKKACCAAP